MTPLARRVVRELTLPVKDRTFDDWAGILSQMDDVHCFEVSAVIETARAFKGKIVEAGVDVRSTFLPAPKTWIEWRDEGGRRSAVLLIARPSDSVERINVSESDSFGVSALPLRYRPTPAHASRLIDARRWLAGRKESDEELLMLLAFINTPRIIGRTTHMPHAGLQRKLARAKGLAGKFPLRAWTELKLEVCIPEQSSGSQEIRLSGAKALHFVRSHIRYRLGALEIVCSHWRGDASLGIKQTRYALKAPTDGRWPVNVH